MPRQVGVLESLGLGTVILQRRLVGPRHVLLEEGLLLQRRELILEERRPQEVRVPRLPGIFGLSGDNITSYVLNLMSKINSRSLISKMLKRSEIAR